LEDGLGELLGQRPLVARDRVTGAVEEFVDARTQGLDHHRRRSYRRDVHTRRPDSNVSGRAARARRHCA
jgi:hypothetical protein